MGQAEIWFLIFLSTATTIPMHSLTACVTNAVVLSQFLETSIACVSPDLDKEEIGQMPIIFTNGVMEPRPR